MSFARLRVSVAAVALAVVACGCGPGTPDGRLVLRDAAARELGLTERTLIEVDSSTVPAPARERANSLRAELDGAPVPVRYYSTPASEFVALIPSYSFEDNDPHVVSAFASDGEPNLRLTLRTYQAVEMYCPAPKRTNTAGWWRDSTDGCRYFDPMIRAIPAPMRPRM
jgi:hypothetical protein